MRMSTQFGRTLRETPADVEVAGHGLLLRAGFIRQHAAGIFSLLPFGFRSQQRLESILREEMAAMGGQALEMPVVHPADLWRRTGRYDQVGPEMGRFEDRAGRDMVLAMTHEETVAELTRSEVQSWRQLPRLIYHIQTKWRDDARPRAGLIRAREFTMLDSYSLDADDEGLERQYEAHDRAYRRIFARCGLPVVGVDADVGGMGGSASREYMMLTPIGEDTVLQCDACGHAANRQVATTKRPPIAEEAALPVERVETPECTTIAALAAFLDIPAARTAKAIFLMAAVPDSAPNTRPSEAQQANADTKPDNHQSERLVLALVRGDRELAETKLAGWLGASALRPAREDEIRASGCVPGYASPVGWSPHADRLVIVDPSVAEAANLVGGANEQGVHLRNLNFGRDYDGTVVDLIAAREGDGCPDCGEPLAARRGVEVGNIFKLGTRYTEAVGARFLNREGVPQPVIMGSYGIGVGRTLQCVAEAHHDEDGLIWPISVAPFDVHLVSMRGAEDMAAAVYEALESAGIDVLWDDRDERPGVKFADADLIGVPVRLTAGKRGAKAGGVELKLRAEPESRDGLVLLEDAAQSIQRILDELYTGLEPVDPPKRAVG